MSNDSNKENNKLTGKKMSTKKKMKTRIQKWTRGPLSADEFLYRVNFKKVIIIFRMHMQKLKKEKRNGCTGKKTIVSYSVIIFTFC